MIKEVSLIIPNKSDEEKLSILLSSMLDWKATPNEIIIINTSSNEIFIPNDFKSFYKDKNIHFYILQKKNVYPGGARNFAIKKATNSLLAFLDTSTHPSNDWLSRGLEIIENGNYEGVWGSTYYEANLFISRIFRACTYGEKPIKTFPGSILHKDVFTKCGLFIEFTRAGEDGDFMSRVELHNINITKSENFLKYDKLDRMNLTEIVKKWYRNYFHTAKMPYFRAHKDIYFYGTSLVAVIAAYNWNRIVDPTGTENQLFVPNITKISILLILLVYFYIRGIYLPLKKGTNLKTVFPFNFIMISFLSAVLDLTKILAFVKSKFYKNKKIN